MWNEKKNNKNLSVFMHFARCVRAKPLFVMLKSVLSENFDIIVFLNGRRMYMTMVMDI
jgi:hypothetical protein